MQRPPPRPGGGPSEVQAEPGPEEQALLGLDGAPHVCHAGRRQAGGDAPRGRGGQGATGRSRPKRRSDRRRPLQGGSQETAQMIKNPK